MKLKRERSNFRVLNSLIGTYECKADAKGRIAIPMLLKNQLSPVMNQGFVLKKSVYQSCLELYPMEQWNELMNKLKRRNRDRRVNNAFMRKFVADSRPVEIDSAGRLLIPKDLAVKVGISKNVVLSSVIDIVELWDKDKYAIALDEAEDGFEDLMDEIMGGDADELS